MSHHHIENPVKIALCVVAFTILFTFMSTFVKLAADSGTPTFAIMFWRFLFGAVPVTLYLMAHKKLRASLFHTHWQSLVMRGLMGIMAMWCIFKSLAMLPIAEAVTLHFAAPFIMTLLSIVILKEHVGPWRWGAIIAGFIGVLLILRPDFEGALVGQFIALCAATIIALNTHLIRNLASRVTPEAMAFYVHLVGLVVLAPFAIGESYVPSTLEWLYLLGAGVSAGFGQLLLNYAYMAAPAPYVSAFSYIQIIFVTFVSLWVFDVVPQPTFFVGAGIIVASGIAIIMREILNKKKIQAITTL